MLPSWDLNAGPTPPFHRDKGRDILSPGDNGSVAEITSGLKADTDLVVTNPTGQMQEGQEVKVVVEEQGRQASLLHPGYLDSGG